LFTSNGVQGAMDDASMRKMMQMIKPIELIKLIKPDAADTGIPNGAL
jgi:hypothetical protein